MGCIILGDLCDFRRYFQGFEKERKRFTPESHTHFCVRTFINGFVFWEMWWPSNIDRFQLRLQRNCSGKSMHSQSHTHALFSSELITDKVTQWGQELCVLCSLLTCAFMLSGKFQLIVHQDSQVQGPFSYPKIVLIIHNNGPHQNQIFDNTSALCLALWPQNQICLGSF